MEKHGNDRTADRELEPNEPLAKAVRGGLDSPQSPADQAAGDPPEDVAILYSWANLQGAKYRDFSANRREYRAQMRRHAAELLREQEVRDSYHPDPVATEPEPVIAEASIAAIAESQLPTLDPAIPEPHATEPQSPEPQVVESQLPDPIPSEPEIAPTYASSDPTPAPVEERHEGLENSDATQPAEISLFRALVMHADSLQQSDEPTGSIHASVESTPDTPEPLPQAEPPMQQAEASPSPVDQAPPAQAPTTAAAEAAPPTHPTPQPPRPPSTFSPELDLVDGPAWLYSPQEPFGNRPRTVLQATTTRIADTLQTSKERVAARWYALKGVFNQNPPNVSHDFEELEHEGGRPPVLAVFSLAGGVGKTSLVATLGRTLSGLDERVLLADTTTHGLLPFYYGASEIHPGRLRTFWPPSGCNDAPVQIVNYDVDRRSELQTQQTREERKSHDSVSQDKLLEDLYRHSRGTHRILLDLAATSSWIVRRVARMNPTILLPIAADMNSVITLRSVTRFFQSILDSEGKPLQPYFVLNQFDNKLPLHLDVREVLVQQLGDRLLPFVIHRDPAMSEALAEGMTIVDYEPSSVVAQDFINLANWVRRTSAPVSGESDIMRWSEK